MYLTCSLAFTKYKNILTSCLRKAEDNHFKDIINSEKQNLYKLWTIFGNTINPSKQKQKNTIKELLYNNRMLQDDQIKADAISDHFSTTGKKMASNINTKHNLKKYLDDPNQHTCFLYPTNQQEVIKEINKLNLKKSVGHDKVSPKIIKYNGDVLLPHITHITNLSFKNGNVPEQLKLAKLIPIYKKNETHLPEN